MINPYNLPNPLMEQLFISFKTIKDIQKMYIKKIILQLFIIFFISLVLFLLNLNLIVFIPILILTTIDTITIRHILEKSRLKKIFDLYNGDEYEIQEINNEKILALLKDVHNSEGEAKAYFNFVSFIFVLILLLLLVWIGLEVNIFIVNLISSNIHY